MKKLALSLLAATAFVLATSASARADEFAEIASSPYTYWVPPPPGYYAAPPPYYYGPRPAPAYNGPGFFIHFHFH